jgi:hypothetical protein
LNEKNLTESLFEVGAGTTNQWQHAVWSGARYVSHQVVDTGASSASASASASETKTATIGSATGLVVESLDAALACPIVQGAGLLGDSSPVGEGLPETPHPTGSISGMAFNLYNNLMPISGFNQWYPFGVGEFYQQNDTASLFRFKIQEV